MHAINALCSYTYDSCCNTLKWIESQYQGRRISDYTFTPTIPWQKVKAVALLLLATSASGRTWTAKMCDNNCICGTYSSQAGVVGLFDVDIQISHPRIAPHLEPEPVTGHLGRKMMTGEPLTKNHPFPQTTQDLNLYHATAMAGVIVENSDLKLVPLVLSDSSPSQKLPSIHVDLLEYAVRRGINLLIYPITTPMQSISQISYNAYAAFPGIIVAAAGNLGMPVENSGLFPQSLEIANTLLVGSVDRHGQIEKISNYGKNVEFYLDPSSIHTLAVPCFEGKTECEMAFAPGRNGYGTSIGCSILGKTIAQMQQIDPKLRLNQIKEILRKTGKALPQQKRAKGQKGTIVNVEKALNAVRAARV